MIRTQIQLPAPLYKDLKRIAAQNDWSLAEVIRRAGEQYAVRYPHPQVGTWTFPVGRDVGGDFLMDPADYHAEADAVEDKLLGR